jgi:hypothetical protein
MIGSAFVSSLKYFSTVMPCWVTAKTVRSFPMILSSISFCLIRKSSFSLSTLQLTFALYMMCVNFNGPLFANTLRMAMCISSFDRLIFEPFPVLLNSVKVFISFCFLLLFYSNNFAFY